MDAKEKAQRTVEKFTIQANAELTELFADVLEDAIDGERWACRGILQNKLDELENATPFDELLWLNLKSIREQIDARQA